MENLLTTAEQSAEQFAQNYATDAAGKVVPASVAAAVVPVVKNTAQVKTISLADFLAVLVLLANTYLATTKTK